MENKNNQDDLLLKYLSDENRIDIEQADALQTELHTLGKMAASFAPKPVNSIDTQTRNPFLMDFITPALACSLALLLVLFTYKTYGPAGNFKVVAIETVYQEIETDEIFMNEVDALVEETAYSDFYPDITTVESRYDFSDDFIEVIVPI